MKLFYSVNSPYARMVRLLAIEKGVLDRITLIAVNSLESPPELLEVNPLSKVPVLITDDGLALCDSSLICEYFERTNDLPLTSDSFADDFSIRANAFLAKGAIDAAVGLVVISRLPPEQQSPLWKERHANAITRTLDALEEHLPPSGEVNMYAITLAALLGYLNFRHPGMDWKTAHPQSAAWFDEFSERKAMLATMPQA